jgi:hypothetical protein
MRRGGQSNGSRNLYKPVHRLVRFSAGSRRRGMVLRFARGKRLANDLAPRGAPAGGRSMDGTSSVRAPHTRSMSAAVRGIAAALALCGLCSTAAHATHFRYAHVNWSHVGPAADRTIQFTVQAAWRQDGVSNSGGGGAYRCVDPAGFVNQSTKLPTIPCTGPVIGGKANPGKDDVFVEDIGTTFLDFGDGNQVGGPGGDPLLFLVTSADPTNNWVFASALDPNSLPAVDTTIQHTYASSGVVTAQISDCCRISPCTSPNAHINNPDNNYRVTTVVNVGGLSASTGTPNSSPVSALPPIVLCPQDALCSFTIPVSDNEGDPVTFRLSTNTEDGFNSGSTGRGQPGLGGTCPTGHAASVSSSGVYTWDTTGCRLAGSPTPIPPNGGCGPADSMFNTLYSTQVMISEAGSNTANTAVDFFIQLVPACQGSNRPPVFDQQAPGPPCGSTVSAGPGTAVSFAVRATDPDTGDSVELNVAGLPANATMTPTLPTTANPVTSTLSWTPVLADIGQHVLNFTATDQCGLQVLCPITIDVSQENCTDGVDNDGDGLIDCSDPDCNGTCIDGNACTVDSCDPSTHQCVHDPAPLNGTACDDGLFCTQNDTCQAGTCTGAPANCSDGDPCTIDTCDEGTNACLNTPAPNGSACDDGNACTQNDQCNGGTCAGTSFSCDDGNVCNGIETCNPATGCVPGTPLDCSDGLACNGTETCDPVSGCQAGTPLDCSAAADGCNDASCIEPGTCVRTPKIDGFGCDDGNVCTLNDRCLGGVCVGSSTGDTDGDGYCDLQEIQAGCNANDYREIPPQPNVYAGGRSAGNGEILLTFRAPGDRDVPMSTDPSCATTGVCNLANHFCTAGRVSDPCIQDSDCDQPAGTCRIVINYAATPAPIPDLALVTATVSIPRQLKQSILPLFQPVTPGCTRKVDISLAPGFKKASVRFKAQGTTGGKLRKDRDLIRYKP